MLGAHDIWREYIALYANDIKIRKKPRKGNASEKPAFLLYDEKHTRVPMHSGMRDAFICLSGTEIEMERSRILLLKT